MKRLALLLLGAAALAGCSNADTKTEELPKVYMTTDISPEGLVRVYDALGVEADGKVAVKISTGEPGGKNYLKPELIGKLVQSVDGTIVECNTAYRGRRFSSEEHLKAAREHGFFEIAACHNATEMNCQRKFQRWISGSESLIIWGLSMRLSLPPPPP